MRQLVRNNVLADSSTLRVFVSSSEKRRKLCTDDCTTRSRIVVLVENRTGFNNPWLKGSLENTKANIGIL